MENLSNHWLDQTQILNLSLVNQTKFVIPSNEDHLKILKVEYLSTLDQIFLKYYILAKVTKPKFNIALNEDDHISKGKFIGKLECGSAQPSFFTFLTGAMCMSGNIIKFSRFSVKSFINS